MARRQILFRSTAVLFSDGSIGHCRNVWKSASQLHQAREYTSAEHFFREITCTKNGVKLRAQGGLSYSRMRELLLEKLAQVGLDRTNFGLHSLRAGGASATANAGVPDRLFKRHGRWRSENAKDGYVKDSLSSRLVVTKGLGL